MGSAHIKSQNGPSSGISLTLFKLFILSIFDMKLIYFIQLIRNSTMDTKIDIIYQCCQRKKIKNLDEIVINLLIVFNKDLCFEIIDCCHCATLVVSSQTCNSCRIVNFQCHNNRKNFSREQSTINIIAKKKKLLFLAKSLNISISISSSNNAQNFDKIIKLTMQIPNNHSIPIDPNQIRLIFYIMPYVLIIFLNLPISSNKSDLLSCSSCSRHAFRYLILYCLN